MNRCDVIVVGAGTGGALAAKTLASQGLDVYLVDRKDRRSIGDKVCGDAIEKQYFDHLGLAYPKGEELERGISGMKVHSPDLKTVFRVMREGLSGFIINRHVFGQRLLKDAVDAGAVLIDSTHVSEPILENGYVKGVSARNTETGSRIELRAEVTVDASGFSAVVRSKLPPEIGIEATVRNKDLLACYREIRTLKREMEESEFCEIYLDQKAAPGGYHWIFPRKGSEVNIGLGLTAVGDFQNPKTQLYKHVLSRRMFKGSTVIHGGGGIVSIHKSLDSFVGNGVVVIGDAACQVNSVNGGGMGLSMVGGTIAGEVIAETLEKGYPSQERLWPINVQYMKACGLKQARTYVFRLLLQGLDNEDLNYGMGHRLIKEEDVLTANLGEEIHMNVGDATLRILRGLSNLSLLRKIYGMARRSKEVKALYGNYPDSPRGMKEWKTKGSDFFSD